MSSQSISKRGYHLRRVAFRKECLPSNLGYPNEDTEETLKKQNVLKEQSKPRFRKDKNRILDAKHIVEDEYKTMVQICTNETS